MSDHSSGAGLAGQRLLLAFVSYTQVDQEWAEWIA